MKLPVWLSMVLLTSAVTSWSQEEWSEWRGPAGAGHAAGFGEVSKWPEILELAWKIPVGLGHAAPVVSAERVCLHSREEKNEVVSCYDLASGAEMWSHDYPAPFNTAFGGGHHGAGPKATPTLRDDRLFTFGISGVLSAWDVQTGELLWRRDFNEEFKKPWPRWGVASSPLAADGRVYVHAGRKQGVFAALDARTGKEIWRVDRIRSAYGSPVSTALDGVRQIVALSEDGPLGISVDGEVLWRYDHERDQNIPSPVVVDGLVLQASKGRPTRALRPRRDGDIWSVATVWENKEIPLHMSTAVATTEHVCGFSHRKKGFAFCADTGSGTLVWRSPSRFAKHASVVVVPGALLFFTSKGRLRVLDDGDSYRELASYGLTKSEVWAHPAMLDQALVVKSKDELLHWRIPKR